MELNRYFEIRIYGVSNELATTKGELINTQDNQSILVLRTNDTYINNPQYFGIAEGSMNLEEILCDGEFTLGALCSDKFEVELFNICEDLSGLDIQVDVTENGITSRLFTGIIDSSTYDDYSMSRKIVAYDTYYNKKDTNVASWWNNYWDNLGSTTSTLKALRESFGVTSSSDLPNDDLLVYNYNYFTTITWYDMLKMICEVQACIPHVNREGELELVQLSHIAQTLEHYDANTPMYEDYVTLNPDGIDIYDSSSNLSIRLKEDATNAYPISGNIFILSLQSNNELLNACSNIFNAISDITYTPATISMIYSNLSLKLGDQITTYGGTHFIMSQTFSGSLLVEQEIKCEAYGETMNQEPSTSNDSLIEGKRFASLQVTLDGITSQVGQINSTIDGLRGEMTTIAQTESGVAIDTFKQTDAYYKGLQTNFNFSAEDGLIISGSTNGAKNDTQLQLTTNGVFIEDSSGTEITSMQKNTFKTGDWVLQQTNDNKTFNIFREV